jgi:hypothetical protein
MIGRCSRRRLVRRETAAPPRDTARGSIPCTSRGTARVLAAYRVRRLMKREGRQAPTATSDSDAARRLGDIESRWFPEVPAIPDSIDLEDGKPPRRRRQQITPAYSAPTASAAARSIASNAGDSSALSALPPRAMLVHSRRLFATWRQHALADDEDGRSRPSCEGSPARSRRALQLQRAKSGRRSLSLTRTMPRPFAARSGFTMTSFISETPPSHRPFARHDAFGVLSPSLEQRRVINLSTVAR